MLTLRPYQREAIDSLYRYFETSTGNPLVVMPTGCHAAGTRILMFDGSIKAVEEVSIGDVLMGPDSRPRRVLQLARGREMMYQISPLKGEPFIVNESHVLSLKTTNEGKPHACTTTGTEIDNITVRDWLGKSNSWRHLRKLRRVAADFSVKEDPPLDPWCLAAPPETDDPAEVVADKGYFSREVLKGLEDGPWKSRIAEPQRNGINHWNGDHEARRAVYNNRIRISSGIAKAVAKRRTELVERSFEHILDRGGMRRVWLRGRENIHKRYLIHVAGFNLGLLMRKKHGFGTPRGLADRLYLLFATLTDGNDLVTFMLLTIPGSFVVPVAVVTHTWPKD